MEQPVNKREPHKPAKKPYPDSLAGTFRELAPYLQFGLVLAISIYLMHLAGNYLDEKWGTRPWLSLVGIMFAIIGNFYRFFKAVLNSSKDKK